MKQLLVILLFIAACKKENVEPTIGKYPVNQKSYINGQPEKLADTSTIGWVRFHKAALANKEAGKPFTFEIYYLTKRHLPNPLAITTDSNGVGTVKWSNGWINTYVYKGDTLKELSGSITNVYVLK